MSYHGLLSAIICDRDPRFWETYVKVNEATKYFTLIKISLSSINRWHFQSYPQDYRSGITNRCIKWQVASVLYLLSICLLTP